MTAFLKTIPSWKHSLTASLSDFPGLEFQAQHPTKHSFLPLREVRNSLPPGAPVPPPARGDPAVTRPPTLPGAPGTGLRRARSLRGRAVPGGALQAASLGAGTLPSCAPLPRTRTRSSRSGSPEPPPACAPSALTRPHARARARPSCSTCSAPPAPSLPRSPCVSEPSPGRIRGRSAGPGHGHGGAAGDPLTGLEERRGPWRPLFPTWSRGPALHAWARSRSPSGWSRQPGGRRKGRRRRVS